MRVLLLLFFLLTMPAFADECQSTNITTCTNCDTPGKYCSTAPSSFNPNGVCSPCMDGAYCPGNQKQYCCAEISNTNGAFPFSDKDQDSQTGAKSQYECYKKLDDETGNGHGAKCIGTNGEPVNDTCREYYRDGTGNNTTINLNGTNYTYKGNTAHHWVSCPNANNQYDIGEGSDNTLDSAGYHMEDTNTECYANKLTCKSFSAFAGNNSNAASLNCNSTTGYLVYDTNTSNAYVWQNENNASCTCDIAGGELNDPINTNTYICNTSETTYTQSGSSISSQPTVQGTKIYYYPIPSGWTCKSCKAGYVGFFKYASGNNNNKRKCMPAVQGCYSDGCTLDTDSPCFENSQLIVFPDPEYYSSRFMCDNILPAYSYYWDALKKFYHPCYAGMTTFRFSNPDDPNSGLNLAQTTDGAFSPRQCHYTNDTNFCDAYGCVSMDQLLGATGTSQTDWMWYMEQ